MNNYWKSSRIRRIRLMLDMLLTVIAFKIPMFFITGAVEPKGYLPAIVYILSVVIFAFGFEVYAALPLTSAEITISLALTTVYSFVLMMLSGLVLSYGGIACALTLPTMIIASVLSFVFLTISNFSYKIFLEQRKCKPRMLMLDEKGGDLRRLKRLRYSSTKAYDIWYEQIDTADPKAVQRSITKLLPQFDSLYLFEGIENAVQRKYIQAAMELKIEIFIVPILFDMIYNKIQTVHFDDVLGFHMQPYHLSTAQALIKRAMDLIFATLLLAVALIPMLLIMVIISISSPGPVFYTQERLTFAKKSFNIYKFRTMSVDAEKLSGPVFSNKKDPRVTPVGAVLRKYRLDELPQLFNVLLGHMSLVGPRPERPFFVEQFEKEIDCYEQRFAVKAGLTSLSHVYGRYSTGIKDRTRYDLLYISNYSCLLDIKILLHTSRVIFLPSASEGVDMQVSSNSVPINAPAKAAPDTQIQDSAKAPIKKTAGIRL